MLRISKGKRSLVSETKMKRLKEMKNPPLATESTLAQYSTPKSVHFTNLVSLPH